MVSCRTTTARTADIYATSYKLFDDPFRTGMAVSSRAGYDSGYSASSQFEIAKATHVNGIRCMAERDMKLHGCDAKPRRFASSDSSLKLYSVSHRGKSTALYEHILSKAEAHCPPSIEVALLT